jgi:hypothetical protein
MIRFALVVTGLLAASGSVLAGELFTPSSPQGVTGNSFTCFILNVDDKTRSVSVELKDADGTTQGPTLIDFALAPGQTRGIVMESSIGFAYCKFTVQGNKDHFRAALVVTTQNGAVPTLALPAQ